VVQNTIALFSVNNYISIVHFIYLYWSWSLFWW